MNINDLAKQNNLTRNEVVILKEIISRINQGIDKIPIRDIAKETFVSTASIIRLSKKLGYSGYSEMLFELKMESMSTIEYKVSDTIRSVLIDENSLVVIDELIQDIVSQNYQRIHILGVGYSDYVAKYFAEKLVEMDCFATTKSPLDFDTEKKSLVLFVSDRGETSDLIFIQERCEQKKYKMYALSTNEKSTLCNNIKRNIIIKRKKLRNKYPNYFIGNSINLIESIVAILYASKKEV